MHIELLASPHCFPIDSSPSQVSFLVRVCWQGNDYALASLQKRYHARAQGEISLVTIASLYPPCPHLA